MTTSKSLPLLLLTLAAFILSSCASLVTSQPTFVLEGTTVPVATAASSGPLLLLISPPQADPSLAAAAAELSAAHASEQQLRFEQRSLLDPSQVPTELAVLVLLAPDPGAAALAAAAPNAQVIAIGFTPEAAPNLIALPLDGGADGSPAFIAGYIAAQTAEDWRAGMLYTAASDGLVNDFVAGARYFCGACIPISPPDTDLPMAVQATDLQNWQAAAEQLLSGRALVVFLAPEMQASEAAQYLGSFGVLLIGSASPSAELAASWLATVSTDPPAALRAQLPLALAGQPPASTPSLGLSNINSAYLSEARLADIRLIIQDLQAGFIVLPAD